MSGALPTLLVHESLRGRLHAMAAGRSLQIGYFRSCRCGALVGDITSAWRVQPPGSRDAALAPIEGVSVVADPRLLNVLWLAGPELRPGGWFHRETPSIWLADPAYWIDFLEGRLPSATRFGAGPLQARPRVDCPTSIR